MQKIVKKFFSLPSIKLNTLVVFAIVLLLLVSLGVLFYFTRKALVEESKMDAEERLECTVQQVDNILRGIEQSVGNFYFSLYQHLDEPEFMMTFCRRMVECNPNIQGCAIAFRPDFYPDHELFINYVYRKKYNSPELIMTDESVNLPYIQQRWYSETMETGRASWIDPGQNHDSQIEPVITFCLPIRDVNKECVGVVSIGLSINLLSQIVLETKPSPNSYSILLAQDGSYIIHPNREKLEGQNIFKQPDVSESPTAIAAAKAMVQGGTGDMSFRMNDFTWYLFYKPFVRASVSGRSMEALNWSIATVYPKGDIFGEYDHLILHVLGIVVVALLVFYVLCKRAIRKQLKPLVYLTESAERIAEGHYDETIPNVKREDEVGVFYKHFQLMQQALAADIARQNEQGDTIREHQEEMQKLLRQIQDDDHVKSIFLHNVTNRMIAPAESVFNSVAALCDNYQNMTLAEANKEADNIKQQSETIIELLSHKFNASPSEAGKEDSHE